ncbi:MAG: tRNA 2-thiouridine(34) synthase MnmA [Bacteroidales bacterium]|nr:tRNA 2-thiouridine(34) synthase MnmA [Bacteroidales bacterium]MCF8457875.1 tRNA 2-thiouridine(34) synthase MnmA [Bacteroidales bacterium]
METVVIGLSGGVDSSVAASVLKDQGYHVIGLFMKNWHDTTGLLEGDCPSNDDVVFAQLVAHKLKIPFHTVDLSEEYSKRVVDYMFSEYQKGRTPNPDVLCNREIKFDVFIDAARELGADKVATGHYCQKKEIEVDGKNYFRLLAGADKNKDQSYFLCQLSQEQLKLALFPIGDIDKPQVRKIATGLKLATAERKDSQGICFVGKVDLPSFLQQKLEVKVGQIIEIPKDAELYSKRDDMDYSAQPDDEELQKIAKPYYYFPKNGVVVGEHRGAHFYTIGQRKGLNVGGKKEPLFVISIDTEKNIVYTGQGHDHPGLNRRALFISNEELHWIRPDMTMKDGEEMELMVRIRYRQALQKARLLKRETGLFILFKEKQRGITSGQFAAFYDGEELIGSGVIS